MKKANLLLFFVFVLILGWLKFGYHELWRDEWQAWFIATDTPTIFEMLSHLTKEGHPPLWYLWLRAWGKVISLAFPNVLHENIIQIAHFTVMAAVFFVLFLKLRLPVWIKAGVAFSYFLFFEYGIINRGYSFTILFIFILSYFANSGLKGKRHFVLVAPLFLLGLTEIYGLFAAISFFFYFAYDDIRLKKFSRNSMVLGGFVVLSGLLTISSVISAPENVSEYTFNQLGEFQPRLFLSAFQGLVANTFQIGLIPGVHKGITTIGIIFSLATLGIFLYYFYRESRKAFTAYLAFFIMIYLFTSIFYLGGFRHWGMHFIFFVAILNIVGIKTPDALSKVFLGLVGLTLLFQVIHNSKIVKREHEELFSNAISAGNFIKKNIPEDVPIFAVNKFFNTPVIGYAGRKFRSFPDGEEFSFFNIRERMYIPHVKDLEYQKRRLGADHIYIISYKPLDLRGYPGLQPVSSFSGRSIRDENYFIYRY